MWQKRDFSVTTRASVFWTSCRRARFWNRCASKKRVTVQSGSYYCCSYRLTSLSEGRSNVAQCTNVKVRCLACFGNLPIEGHSRIKINTQILDRWLKLDEWTSNWNGCNGFSQGFKRFGPWVEKSNGFRLGWIEVKTIVQEPVVNPLSARFYRSDLMCERRQVSTNIQPIVIGVPMEGHSVTGIWQVRIYDTGDRWYEENKKSGPRTEPWVHLCILLRWNDESMRMTSQILTKDVRLVR